MIPAEEPLRCKAKKPRGLGQSPSVIVPVRLVKEITLQLHNLNGKPGSKTTTDSIHLAKAIRIIDELFAPGQCSWRWFFRCSHSQNEASALVCSPYEAPLIIGSSRLGR